MLLLGGVERLTRTWLTKARGNLTQEEVAHRTGITRQFYSMIENGERTPSVKVAKKIASTLGVDWTLFFAEQGNEMLPKEQPANEADTA